MKTKNLFLSVICLFSFILSSITAYSSNYHSEVKLASQQLDTSEHFIAFKLPLVAHTKKQFRQLITIVDESAQKFGLNYMEKNVYLGYPLTWNSLELTGTEKVFLNRTFTSIIYIKLVF